MKYLIIAAHPDDEVLGCGGSIARWTKEGHEVFIAILGEGITSRYQTRQQADPSLLLQLQENTRKVAKFLGAKDIFSYNLPDNRFDTTALLDIVKIIESLIEKIKPQVVYTQHGGDLNIDHNIVFRATLTATRPLKGHCVKAVYAYEVASSTEWAFGQFSPTFKPNTFVAIEDTLETKVQAMQFYESEAREFPHPRAPQSLRAIAQNWGRMVGLEAAEAFELIRNIC